MSRMCDKCIKRKTMWCPNSSECYNSQEVPYFMNNVMALQELERYKNIIDELEKILNILIEDNGVSPNSKEDFKYILDKLKELKGE